MPPKTQSHKKIFCSQIHNLDSAWLGQLFSVSGYLKPSLGRFTRLGARIILRFFQSHPCTWTEVTQRLSSFGTVTGRAYSWPLRVFGASSQHHSLKVVKLLRVAQGSKSRCSQQTRWDHLYGLYDLPSEIIKHQFCCTLLTEAVRNPSRFEGRGHRSPTSWWQKCQRIYVINSML